jgi:hypothetical protein
MTSEEYLKRSSMKSILFLLLISPSLFAATDTIHGPGDPQFKGSIDLKTSSGDTAHMWKVFIAAHEPLSRLE